MLMNSLTPRFIPQISAQVQNIFFCWLASLWAHFVLVVIENYPNAKIVLNSHNATYTKQKKEYILTWKISKNKKA